MKSSHETPITTNPFAMYPVDVMKSDTYRALSQGSRLVYIVLFSFSDKFGTDVWPTAAMIADRTAMKKRSVQNCIAELRRSGLIEAYQDGGRRKIQLHRGGTSYSVGGVHPTMEGGTSYSVGGVHPTMEGGTPYNVPPQNAETLCEPAIAGNLEEVSSIELVPDHIPDHIPDHQQTIIPESPIDASDPPVSDKEKKPKSIKKAKKPIVTVDDAMLRILDRHKYTQNHSGVIDYYHDLYCYRYKHKPSFHIREFKNAKLLLAHLVDDIGDAEVGFEAACECLKLAFSRTIWPWDKDEVPTLTNIYSNVNRLVPLIAHVYRRAKKRKGQNATIVSMVDEIIQQKETEIEQPEQIQGD